MIRMSKKDLNRPHMKSLLALILAAITTITCMIPTYADDWDGWDDEAIESAWTAYLLTTWSEVQGLSFSISDNGSIASADVSSSFREKYQSVIETLLSNCYLGLQFKDETNSNDKTQYTELILALAYKLNKKGEALFTGNGFATEDIDVCFINKYIDPSAVITSVEDSFYALIKNYYFAERYYLIYHPLEDEAYSIYKNNENLQSIIQGVIYGTSFVKAYAQYTTDNAKTFYNENIDEMNEIGKLEWNSFAREVQEIYKAQPSIYDNVIFG